MKRYIFLASCYLFHVQPASAQLLDKLSEDTSQAEGGIKLEGGLTLSPALGKSRPFDQSETLLDESEGELVARLSVPVAGSTLKLTGGISATPRLFDDVAPESAHYGEAKFERQFAVGKARDASLSDTITAYAAYRRTVAHQDFLGHSSRSDNSFTIGVTYENTLWLWRRCVECQNPVALKELSKGPAISFTPEFAYVDSTDPDRRRLSPSVQLKLAYPLMSGASLFVKVKGTAALYDRARLDFGRKREDYKLTIDPGIALQDLLGLPKGMELAIAARFARNWSNKPDARYSRFYAVPSFSLKIPMGG